MQRRKKSHFSLKKKKKKITVVSPSTKTKGYMVGFIQLFSENFLSFIILLDSHPHQFRKTESQMKIKNKKKKKKMF
jgi:hypothetical protein